MFSFYSTLKHRQSFGQYSKHNFHIVTTSPWPFFGSLGSFFLTLGLVGWMHYYAFSGWLVIFGLLFIFLIMYVWWRDIVRESTYLGFHTSLVQHGLRLGVILFIVSEVMFFFAFFWAFFHSSLAPNPVIGSVWPPIGLNILNPLHVPLLNTVILLMSGVTVTLSHYGLCINRPLVSIYSLIVTILLAIEFTALQVLEYFSALFYLADGAYGASFYLATGFHGFHVLVGSTFLFFCLLRMISGHFHESHHLGYEAAIWYWHFVDVVWLFLFLTIYGWGSGECGSFLNF